MKKIKIMIVLGLILSINISVLAEDKTVNEQGFDDLTEENSGAEKVVEENEEVIENNHQNEETLEVEQKDEALKDQKEKTINEHEDLLSKKFLEKKEVSFKEKKDSDTTKSEKVKSGAVDVSNWSEFVEAYNNPKISIIYVEGEIIEREEESLQDRSSTLKIKAKTKNASLSLSTHYNPLPLASSSSKQDLIFKGIKIDAPQSSFITGNNEWKLFFEDSQLYLRRMKAMEIHLQGSSLLMDSEFSSTSVNALEAEKLKFEDSQIQIDNLVNTFSANKMRFINSDLKIKSTQKGDFIFKTKENRSETYFEFIDSQMSLEVAHVTKIFRQRNSQQSQIVFNGQRTRIDIKTFPSQDNSSTSIFNVKDTQSSFAEVLVKNGAQVNVDMGRPGYAFYLRSKQTAVMVEGKGSRLSIQHNFPEKMNTSRNIIYFYTPKSLLKVSDQAEMKMHISETESSPGMFYMYASDSDNSSKSHEILVDKGAKLILESAALGASGIQFSRYSNPLINVQGLGSKMSIAMKDNNAIEYNPKQGDKLRVNVQDKANFIVENKSDKGTIQGEQLDLFFDDAFFDIVNRSGKKALNISKSSSNLTSQNIVFSRWKIGNNLDDPASETWLNKGFKLTGGGLENFKDLISEETEKVGNIENYARLQGKGKKMVFEADESFILQKDFIEKIKNNEDLIDYMKVKAIEENLELDIKVTNKDGLNYQKPSPGTYDIHFTIKGHESYHISQKIHVLNYDHLYQDQEYLIVANDFYDNRHAYKKTDDHFIKKSKVKAYRKDDLDKDLVISLKEHGITQKPQNEQEDYLLTFYASEKETIEIQVVARILNRDHVVETIEHVIAANDFEIMEYEAANIQDEEIIRYAKAYGFNKERPKEPLQVIVTNHNIEPIPHKYPAHLKLVEE